MNEVDTSIAHVTDANKNIFEDLGFDKREAEKLNSDPTAAAIYSMQLEVCAG